MDKPARHRSTSPGRSDAHAAGTSHYDYPPEIYSKEPKRSRHPRQEPAAPRPRPRNPEQHLSDDGGRSVHGDPSSRGRRGDRYQQYEPAESGRSRSHWEEDGERAVRRKEKPVRPPPPQGPRERDKAWDRDYKQDRGQDLEWERSRDREQNHRQAREAGRAGERTRDRRPSWDRQGQRDRDRDRARTMSRERELEEDYRHSSSSSREPRASWEEEGDDGERERSARGRQRLLPGPEDVFDEGRGDAREVRDGRQGEGAGRKRGHTHPDDYAGTTEGPSPGAGSGGRVCVCVVVCWRCLLLWKPQVAG